jgi:hypothetical protein
MAPSSTIRKPIAVSKDELIADLKSVQELYPGAQISRNFYRIHGFYSESQWHYYFPTFSNFLSESGIREPWQVSKDTSSASDFLTNWVDMSAYQVGDILEIVGVKLRVTSKNGSSVTVKRQYWYHSLWSCLASSHKDGAKQRLC